MILPLSRPLVPMLARAEAAIPDGPGWLFEPKLDGFRALVHYDGSRVHIDSRNGKLLNPYFPELVEAIPRALEEPSILDGEIVVCVGEGLDFEALQTKLARTGKTESDHGRSASFVAFDLLAIGRHNLTVAPFDTRRKQLERVLRPHAAVTLTPQTDDGRAAAAWMTFKGTGIEGIVAKRSNLPYRPGQRIMVKVRHHRLVDFVVGGYIPHVSGHPGVLLLGLYDRCGELHHVGQTSALSDEEREKAWILLKRLQTHQSFDGGRMPRYGRWPEQRRFDWVSVSPRLACEAKVSNVDNGFIRHAAKLGRWRTDKDPRDCTYSQLA